jgi:hypothetical protein
MNAKIIKIFEDVGHVEFDCGDGVVQRAQDLYTTDADIVKLNVATYCSIYIPESQKEEAQAEIPIEVVQEFRNVENEEFSIQEVVESAHTVTETQPAPIIEEVVTE